MISENSIKIRYPGKVAVCDVSAPLSGTDRRLTDRGREEQTTGVRGVFNKIGVMNKCGLFKVYTSFLISGN